MTRPARALLLLAAVACAPSMVADHQTGGSLTPLPTSDTSHGSDTSYGSDTLVDPTTSGTTETSSTTGSTTTSPSTDPLLGFVGSPCTNDSDCAYDGGTCLLPTDGYPLGTCSVACDQHCPDAPGYPTTFCLDRADLPATTPDLGDDGACLSRCDFELYPYDGCRQGYGCSLETRANDPDTAMWTCMPDATSELTPCLHDLAARGVPFQPTLVPDQVAPDSGGQVCVVEEPVVMQSGYQGIDIIYYDGTEPGSVTGACVLAQAIADTLDDLAIDGVDTLRHLGTTNCRVIAGSSTVSEHGHGRAIDLYGFDFADGRTTTYVDDWQHDTDAPTTTEAQWLYDRAYSWHETWIWNTILTPNYDAAHDNHVHADMKPGNGFIGLTDPRVFGPMEVDE